MTAMLRSHAFSGMLLAGAGALALAGCGAKPPKELPPEPGAAVSTTVTTPDSQLPNGGAAGAGNGAGGNMGAYGAPGAPGTPEDFLAKLRGRETVQFGLDRFNIDSAAAVSLQAQAEWLLKYPGRRATLEGHCDERGTRDYNLALGERRANAAKNYLVSLGVDAARLTTVSYGKERPVDTASTDEAYAKNRRAVTVTVE
jgi:peptidoglycan-associated lipoprotein